MGTTAGVLDNLTGKGVMVNVAEGRGVKLGTLVGVQLGSGIKRVRVGAGAVIVAGLCTGGVAVGEQPITNQDIRNAK
jgi:hypothetical protein